MSQKITCQIINKNKKKATEYPEVTAGVSKSKEKTSAGVSH